MQDVANGVVYITEVTEPGFIKVVLSKLKEVAGENVRDKWFNRVNDLMAHLKKHFAPSKKYQWYFESIVNLRMKQTETVSDCYDQVQGLLSGSKHAIDDTSGPWNAWSQINTLHKVSYESRWQPKGFIMKKSENEIKVTWTDKTNGQMNSSKVPCPIQVLTSTLRYHTCTTHLPLGKIARTLQIQIINQLVFVQTNLMSRGWNL